MRHLGVEVPYVVRLHFGSKDIDREGTLGMWMVMVDILQGGKER